MFLHKCTLTLTPEGQSQQSALTCLHLNAPIGEIRLCCPVQQVAAHTERRLRYTPAALKCLLVIVVFSVYVVRVQMSFCKLQLSEASFIFTSIGRNQVMNPKYCMYCQAPHMHWTLNCKTNTPSAFTHLIWSCSKKSFRNVDCVLLLNYINAGLEIYAQSSGLAVKPRYFRCFASVCLKGRSFGHKRCCVL